MFPASQGLNLNIEAISGIFGSISIACWVVVFSPQIIENFRRSSADGLSLQFIIVWLAGDVFNILGAVIQGVLPTMAILAVYYTLADIVLLGQCFYYRGFTWRDDVAIPNGADERTALLDSHANSKANANGYVNGNRSRNESNATMPRERRLSHHSFVDVTHLSPATPLMLSTEDTYSLGSPARANASRGKTALFNSFAILMVCLAGILGWWISTHNQEPPRDHDPEGDDDHLQLNLWGQIFGYMCAVLYLGSRLPQILLNYRRKSTEGLSGLFFLFACLGNVTYFLSIFAYAPTCHGPEGRCREGEAAQIYARYILLNASWLLGSIGCLFLDFAILVQFFVYMPIDEIDDIEEAVDGMLSERCAARPLLARSDTEIER